MLSAPSVGMRLKYGDQDAAAAGARAAAHAGSAAGLTPAEATSIG